MKGRQRSTLRLLLQQKDAWERPRRVRAETHKAATQASSSSQKLRGLEQSSKATPEALPSIPRPFTSAHLVQQSIVPALHAQPALARRSQHKLHLLHSCCLVSALHLPQVPPPRKPLERNLVSPCQKRDLAGEPAGAPSSSTPPPPGLKEYHPFSLCSP